MDVLRLHTVEQSPESIPERLDSLDWVRAFAALGVVLLHAGVPYLAHPMPGLVWAVQDTPSVAVDWVIWTVEVFIMPLFLVMAGYLLAPSMIRRGPWTTLTSRVKRLGRPLLFGMLVILPIDFYIWLSGWALDGLIPWVKMKSLKFDPGVDRDLWGLSHLWFLLYVITYIALISLVVYSRERASRLPVTFGKRSSFAVLFVAAAIVAFGVLFLHPEVVWGFQHRFEPVPSKWLYSGTFFLVGYLWYKTDPNLSRLARAIDWRWSTMAAIVSVCAVSAGLWHLEQGHLEQDSITETFASRSLVAGLTVAAAWLVTLSIIGTALNQVTRVPRSIQYLAEASFWIYLVHHPILGLLHIGMKHGLPGLSPVPKVAAALSVSVLLSLVSYEYLVRRTRFGRWSGLGEPSRPPVVRLVSDSEAELASASAPAPPVRRAA